MEHFSACCRPLSLTVNFVTDVDAQWPRDERNPLGLGDGPLAGSYFGKWMPALEAAT